MTGERPLLHDWSGYDELRKLQTEQLTRTLAQAAASPFYAARLSGRRLGDPLERLRALPLTTKADLREAYPFGLLAVPRGRLATYHESSGTSGNPTASYYTDDDWSDLAERYARKWVEITPDDTFLIRTPYALMITGHLAQAAARLRGATVVPGDSRSAAMPHARVVRVLRALEVSLTWSNPTEPLLWAAAAAAAGLDPATDFPSLRALFVGGEPLSDARRARLSTIWNAPVVEEYGSTETGSLAGQCPHGRLHFWADRVLPEVCDHTTGEVRDAGRGRLVVTPLYREAMPLLRYDLADDVELAYDDCGCGWRLPSIRVFGRSAFAYRVGNGMVTQNRLEELIFALPAGLGVVFWRARAERELLRVEVEAPEPHRQEVHERLLAAVAAQFGVPARIHVVAPGEIVPSDVLTANPDVLKPRGLFGPDEDWRHAVLYY